MRNKFKGKVKKLLQFDLEDNVNGHIENYLSHTLEFICLVQSNLSLMYNEEMNLILVKLDAGI